MRLVGVRAVIFSFKGYSSKKRNLQLLLTGEAFLFCLQKQCWAKANYTTLKLNPSRKDLIPVLDPYQITLLSNTFQLMPFDMDVLDPS